MASGTKDHIPPKPTFAKVAASSYVPHGKKSSQVNTKTPNAASSLESSPDQPPPGLPSPLRPQPSNGEIPQSDEAMNLPSTNKEQENKDVLPVSTRPAVVALRSEDNVGKTAANDDGSTQVSSDGSAKPPSFDTKSIASGTTFALDEKESLRPDDSASIRAAIEEEDMFSAPGSVVAGSRVGSDLGAKPFREQLQEIPYIGSVPHRGGIGPHYQSAVLPMMMSTSSSARPIPVTANGQTHDANSDSQSSGPSGTVAPDEKLLDALQSQRDRVWVLKLEQDIIDFVGQSKEATLTLPQCNAFYRMLAHKLADYYRLDHAVSQSLTGSAVVITRTPFCKIPPPLSGLTNPAVVSETPPLVTQARKIMRRPGDPKSSENTTAANSEGPSAAASEVGVETGSNDQVQNGSTKSKAQLTREEREKQYAEARERIFGKSDLPEGTEAIVNPDEAEHSRSSSASGKKKNTKKQRNLSNDDFEPRSQFPAYYSTSFPSAGYAQDPYYYPNYAGMPGGQHYSMSPPPGPSAMDYQQPYSAADGQPFNWNGQQTMPVPGPGNGAYQPTPAPGYNLSAHFQNAMQFQVAPNGHTMPGKGHSSPPMSYQPQPIPVAPPMSQWQQPYDPNNPYGQQMYPQPNFQDRSLTTHGAMSPTSPYVFNQFAAQPYPQPMTPKHVTPIPQMQGNYNRPQFNPQIQAFIPSGPASRPNMAPPTPTYASHPASSQAQVARPIIPSNSSSTSQPGYSRSPMPVPNSSIPPTSSNSKDTPSQDLKPQSSVNMTPSMSSGSSSERPVLEITAKFGTPSHLPPRPPPPQTMEPHKYIEINRGIGGLHTYPGLPRVAANGFNGGGPNGQRSNSTQS